MRLFLDSNIAFSAALFEGAVRRLLKDLVEKGHTLVMDSYVWEEARRNLRIYRTGRRFSGKGPAGDIIRTGTTTRVAKDSSISN